MRSGAVVTLVILLGLCPAHAEPDDAKRVRAALERIAAELPYMDQQSMVYEAPSAIYHVEKKEIEQQHNRLMDELRARRDPIRVLRRLLKHEDPKVRTVAMVALYARADPRLLDDIANLLGDNGRTFNGHPSLSHAWMMRTGVGPPPKKQTVADLALAILKFCETRVHDGTADRWWIRRERPEQCVRWMLSRMTWASHRGQPPPGGRAPKRLIALRKTIDTFPEPHQTWVLLRLRRESLGEHLVTDGELVQRLKKIGPTKLVSLLGREGPAEDPDLQAKTSNNWGYSWMCIFVLRHASVLLRREDVPAIRQAAAHEEDYRTHGLTDPMIHGWWYVASARLEPAKAREHLAAGMKAVAGEYRFQRDSQAEIQLVSIELLGPANDAAVLDWFFGAEPGKHASGSSRAALAERLATTAAGRRVLAKIIHDPRWEGLDWFAIRSITLAASTWLEPPIVTPDDAYNLKHPLGARAYITRIHDPEQHAEATAKVLATFARWHAELMRRIPAPKR